MMRTHRRVFLACNAPPYLCSYCGKEITVLEGRGPDSLNVHHVDEDQRNNLPENFSCMHARCHPRHHFKGVAKSEDFREQLSKRRKGVKQTPEHTANHAAAIRGHPNLKLRGRPKSAAHRQALSKPKSFEHREAISKAMKKYWKRRKLLLLLKEEK
jgi:hypothetical protein